MTAPRLDQGLGDVNGGRVSGQVEVAPPERQRFVDAHAGAEEYVDDVGKVSVRAAEPWLPAERRIHDEA
jgi:hypothetical protein